MNDGPGLDDIPTEEPANLRFLRRLVTTLTAVMILGLLVLIALFVIRLQPATLALPDAITLPNGVTAQSFTRGRTWYAVVTEDDQILIFDIETGDLRQTIEIE
ncbi:DUF6476 family protein [Litoreibacter roseus]|uniref:Uncharacterized protein n=1 Tax=Litoreibacter roseus TaxID=2601869 RepID=A0A6N6JCF9_9RHOB|nr:DUF6476 family protein [Litoreibacter roseus]GFE63520.1 hypothetical protein KIN_05940 [Litoreibacter roseus]